MTTELLNYIKQLKEDVQMHYDTYGELHKMGLMAEANCELALWNQLDTVVFKLEEIIEKCEDLREDR